MNKNMPEFKLNEHGIRKPVLLIGPEGRTQAFLTSLFGDEYFDRTDIKVANIDLSNVVRDGDLFQSYPVPKPEGYVEPVVPWLDEEFNKLNQAAKSSPNVVAMFDLERGVLSPVFLDLARFLTSKNELAPEFTPVIHSARYPEALLRSPTLLRNFQVIEYQAPENYLVITEPVHESSPLHEYKMMAADALRHHEQVDAGTLTDTFNTLERFVDALNEVEGGPLGREARERGMDISVYKVLVAFAKVFEATDLGKKIELIFDKKQTLGSFVEREVGPLGLTPKVNRAEKFDSSISCPGG